MRQPPDPSPPPPRLTAWARRAVTIPLYVSAWGVVFASFPFLIALTLVADAVARRGWATSRCLLFAFWYLTCEMVGLVACLATWLLGRAVGRNRYLLWNFRLECWWANSLFTGAQRIFSMRLAVEGADVVSRGPFLLFSRHASIGDTLLPAILISRPHGIVLRYVLKQELLWDPCLDIVGNRLANCFVRRGSGDSESEIASIQRLMEDLGPRDGVLIYPEGTRFTEGKRRRILDRLAKSGDGSAGRRTLSLHHVLPPRLGGPLGLLERNRGADVVFCAHLGFEGAGSFRDLAAGTLIGQLIRVAFWRVPFADIPTDRSQRADWLWQQWKRIDEWIGEHLERPPLSPSVGELRARS